MKSNHAAYCIACGHLTHRFTDKPIYCRETGDKHVACCDNHKDDSYYHRRVNDEHKQLVFLGENNARN